MAMKNEIGPAIQGNPPIQPPNPSPHFRTESVTPAISGGINNILINKRFGTSSEFTVDRAAFQQTISLQIYKLKAKAKKKIQIYIAT
ncbi:hypothetical protein Dfri01_26480 [Dyadobacter frigoris]|nr:hypothetical protein Dfri01_26480 [Dyadobacter frigoris]